MLLHYYRYFSCISATATSCVHFFPRRVYNIWIGSKLTCFFFFKSFFFSFLHLSPPMRVPVTRIPLVHSSPKTEERGGGRRIEEGVCGEKAKEEMWKRVGRKRVSIREVEKKPDKEERARLTSREEGTVRPPWKLERLKVRQGGRISGQAGLATSSTLSHL